MSIREKLMVIVALAAFSPAAVAVERPENALTPLRQDQVTASFQRMLSHAPTPVVPAAPADFERDPLIDALALPLLRWYAETRTQDALASLRRDQVTASFQRILTDAPSNVAPAVPAGFERDPLIEALALPVLRWYAAVRTQTAPQAGSEAVGSARSAVAAIDPAALVR